MNKLFIIIFLLALIGQACSSPQNGQPLSPNDLNGETISVEGTKFIDSYGRQVIFNGINYVNKNRNDNYIFNDSAVVFAHFKKWGFNCIRLGVIWDGVEPYPGKYDEKYLDNIEEQVNKAAQNGLYVFLDMHQDLYSHQFSDGAPTWATLTDGQPHATGAVWSDSYFISPAVQTAFDNFWANKPVVNGIGVQDHYANMWKHIAKRFAGNKTVIGFDIMNEPFNGTQGTQILPVILAEYAKLYTEETGAILSEEEVLTLWANEDSRLKALKMLEDGKKYARVIESATELSQQFEKTDLQAMYQRVANAIREVDTTHILFLEHAYFSNTGVASGIVPVNGKDGNPDPRVAYAAHGYDLLVDTKENGAQSSERVKWIFSQINETAKRINVPVLVGEWGAFSGNSEGNAASAQFIREQFDNYQFSNTYWSYYEGLDKHAYFHKTFDRPYPQYIGGVLKSSSFDHKNGIFTCTWKESTSVKAPTVICISDLKTLKKESLELMPKGNNTVIQSMENSNAGYLIIPVTGKSVERTILFKLNNNQSSITIDEK